MFMTLQLCNNFGYWACPPINAAVVYHCLFLVIWLDHVYTIIITIVNISSFAIFNVYFIIIVVVVVVVAVIFAMVNSARL